MERLKKLAGNSKFAEFPPNCLQFRGLCLAYYEELNIPRAIDAYREIKGREFKRNAPWSHEIVQYIAAKLPRDFLLIHQESQAYAIFEGIYKRVCHLVKQGHSLPKVSDTLMFKKESNPEHAKMHLHAIKQRLGVA